MHLVIITLLQCHTQGSIDQTVSLHGNVCTGSPLHACRPDPMLLLCVPQVLHSDLKVRNVLLKSDGACGRGVVAKVRVKGLSAGSCRQSCACGEVSLLVLHAWQLGLDTSSMLVVHRVCSPKE
jgi:hypothetical protein